MIGREISMKDKVKKEHGKRMIELCRYIEKGDDSDRVVGVWHENTFSSNPGTADKELIALAECNPRAKQPMRHFVLSWPTGEVPTLEQAKEAARITLKESGLDTCLAKMALHKDTDNVHLHIAVCTVDPESMKMKKVEFSHECLLRAVAVIEHQQGWQPEKNAVYHVMPDNTLMRRAPGDRQAKPSQTLRASSMEVYTGQRSASDIAVDEVRMIFRDKNPQSWADLHRELGKVGLVYQKKGSGAVFGVQQDNERVFIKASTILRGAGLSRLNLQQRFGAYQPAEEVAIATRASEAAKGIPEDRAKLWGQYRKDKNEFFRNKKESAARKKMSHQQRRAALHAAQKAERDALYRQNPRNINRGRFHFLHVRSALATIHAKQKAELAEQLRAEHHAWKEKYGKPFPTKFADWLEKRGEIEQAKQQSTFAMPKALFCGDDIPPAKRDIRAYEAMASARNGAVRYLNQHTGSVDFVDYGRKIELLASEDMTAIRAALQLSAEKWKGGFSIQGSDDFKQAAAAEAVRLGMADRIKNPELKQFIDTYRAEMLAARREQEKKRYHPEFQRYHAAVQADRYIVSSVRMNAQGGRQRGQLLSPVQGSLPDAIDWKQIEKKEQNSCLPSSGKDGKGSPDDREHLFLAPVSQGKFHILVDGLDSNGLDRMKRDGWRPAVVLEIAQGEYQAILNVAKGTEDGEANKRLVSHLTQLLNASYGEPKLADSVFHHRIPGIQNKEERNRLDQKDESTTQVYRRVRVLEAVGGMCEKATLLANEKIQSLQQEQAAKQKRQSSQPITIRSEGRRVESFADQAYFLHFDDIGKKASLTDYSRIDTIIAQRMRVTGHSQDEIRKAIERNAPSIRPLNQQGNDWTLHARNKAAGAFTPKSDLDIERQARWHQQWKDIEKAALLQRRHLKKGREGDDYERSLVR